MAFAADGTRDPFLATLLAAKDDAPALVTVPNVPILEAGEDWPLSTGPKTFTAEDIAAAISSQDDPFVRAPVVKIGHRDKRFNAQANDGQPVFGRLINLRASADGQTLYADIAGVPRWLAEVMPYAYPQRSIEGAADWTSPTGVTHRMVLSGLALLGETDPAIGSLEDLQAMFSDLPTLEVDGVSAKLVMASKGARPLAAAVEVEDVRKAFYDSGDMIEALGLWSWVRCVRLDPADLVVEGEDGDLYRVPYTFDAAGVVTFGDPVAIHIEYVDDTTPDAVAASKVKRSNGMATFASRDDSRNGVVASGPGSHKEQQMDPKEIRTRLGLAEDATDADVLAKLDQLTKGKAVPEPTPEPEPEPIPEPVLTPEPTPTPALADPEVDIANLKLPPGFQVIDTNTLETLGVAASKGAAAFENQRVQERETFLSAAIGDGRFPPASRKTYSAMYDRDAEGTRKFVMENLAAGTIPVTERGVDAPSAEAANHATDYNEAWLTPGERQRIAAAKGN